MPNVMAARPNIGGAVCESSVIPFLVPRRKVWLTPSGRVPCSNAANIGERRTWTQSEVMPSKREQECGNHRLPIIFHVSWYRLITVKDRNAGNGLLKRLGERYFGPYFVLVTRILYRVQPAAYPIYISQFPVTYGLHINSQKTKKTYDLWKATTSTATTTTRWLYCVEYICKKLISLKYCVRSQITRLKLQKLFCDLEHVAPLWICY